MKSLEEIKIILDKQLPSEAVMQHPTKTYLSSIKAVYVTERFNEAFGVGGWTLRTEMIERGEKGTVVVKAIFQVPKLDIYYESFGGNDNGGENSKNFDLGDAYKGATTDALTKIGSYLGVGIDVFKGKQTGKAKATPKQETPPPPDNRAWLNVNTEQFDKAVEFIKSGNSIDSIKKKYKISKETELEIYNKVKS